MMNEKELNNLKNILNKNTNKNIAILHCVSRYPTDPLKTNLSYINNLKKKFKTKIGWSDHTQNEIVIYEAATRYKSDFIEIHVDLDDRKGYEGNFEHCWNFSRLSTLFDLVRKQKSFLKESPIKNTAYEKNERLWRADSNDGLRPIARYRKKLIKNL